ncbi:FAD binding domain-containing protein [Aspergillus ambiguus]|uniref:FAD binding domain-containing protein n=1 Tax=Aspergillus ambiguus TaxID=176160 RepID=UPI003CCDF5CE
MAHSILPHTHENGFRQPCKDPHWLHPQDQDLPEYDVGPQYEVPPSVENITSTRHNDLGVNVLRVWPTLHDGTSSPHGLPAWWNPPDKVDVLICGAGPSGLEVALSCLRQGLTFRIIDKNTGPLTAGRADGVQPRFLETLSSWGLASEVHEEGPLIERTAIYHDGQLLHHGRSHQSDSRYRGLHVITQGQIERIFVRDLLRHKVLVERATTLKEYSSDPSLAASTDPSVYPVRCVIEDDEGKETVIQSKFLVGSDGASSAIRHKLQIPFDGVSTDIYWGIMDCIFETDYPHAWIFGSVISTEHGGCVIIPRENGYIRLYTQLNVSQTGPLAASRQAKDPSFSETGGQVDIHSITPEEVLEQANRIFAPYKLSFAAPLSWFAVWKISERVARSFSSNDLRVHLVGDAAHVHSVMGAFGLNASILDAANIGWKMGLCAKGKADPHTLLPTYDRERRLHAANIIEISGKYLRFVCSSHVPTARPHYLGADLGLEELETYKINGLNGVSNIMEASSLSSSEEVSVECYSNSKQNGGVPFTRDEAKAFLHGFFKQHGQFLLGVDAEYGKSCLNPSMKSVNGFDRTERPRPVNVKNGVRAPNPRVCIDDSHTGYLYDKLPGDGRFHLVVFGSNLRGPVRQHLKVLSEEISSKKSTSRFYARFGGPDMFNIVVVAKGMPFEITENFSINEDLATLRDTATVLADDRAPDDDAHSTWGVNHRTGAVVVVRPDLWVGISAAPDDTEKLGAYFERILLE